MSKPLVTRLSAVVAFVLAAPILAGCGDPLQAGGDPGTGPQVVASFYPLQYVAERVTGEHAQVTNLTSPGVEPHDLELTVAQTAQLSEADVVLYQKELQPAVDDAVAQNGPERVVEVTDHVSLKAPGETAEEHGEEGDDEHGDHADHADGDPHFWLDPTLLSAAAAAFADEMADLDPEHAADYRSNLESLQDDLTALDDEYDQGLTDCAVDTVVVSHDAFAYLDKYGLEFEPIAGLSPDAEPSPAHIAELQDLIRDRGITTVFSETLASPAMAETIAGDLGLETAVLDPIEGLTDQTADRDYISLMRSNLAALQEANQCR